MLYNTLKWMQAGAMAVFVISGSAQAWWNDEWTLRKKITLDTGGISDPIGTTTVLLRLHDGDFQFAAAKEDGGDLRFIAADDKTPLAYHIEKYDSLLSEAFVWVKVPDLKSGSQTSIWLYYGNGGGKATRADDSKATYDSNAVLVYHFTEQGSAPADASSNNNNGLNAGTPVSGSMIGGGIQFNGKNPVGIAPSSSLEWAEGGEMTWSAWLKLSTLQSNGVIFSRRDGNNGFVIGADNGVPYVEVSQNGSAQRSSAGTALAAGGWHHWAVVASEQKITIYIDGEMSSSLGAGLPTLKGGALLGGDGADVAAAKGGYTGEMDELEIASTAHPLGAIKLAAFGQGGGDKAAKLLVIGADEQPSSWLSWISTGYFGVIFKSLSLDGWVVIGILGVMAVISWFVMISKVTYLNGISKGNALFMKEWKHVASDLTVLDDGDLEKSKSLGGRIDSKGQKAIRESSVYRIYHIGVEEIRHRLAADRDAGSRKGLSGRSIQAIRASLDGGLVRETQKINSLIVLLTICISGGPFLGLLGTVVGVMITFAAVAAAGDVNVNAIAPGIAAALLATVAGLAVAIPSLFGYNYILSRVKDATADMHVFIDEFVTKMAEFYREPSHGEVIEHAGK